LVGGLADPLLSDDRKDWIKWHTEDVNQRREQNLPDDYLYKKIQNKLILTIL